MINIALVSYSLPAPRCRRFMLRQAAAFAVLLQLVRALFLRIFARGSLRIVWVLHHRALGGLLRGSVRPPSTRRPMPSPVALLALRSAPPPLSPMRGRAGASILRLSRCARRLRRLSPAPPPLSRTAGGRASLRSARARGLVQARTRSTPTLNNGLVYWLGSAVRRAPFGVLHSAQLGALAGSLARFRSAVALRLQRRCAPLPTQTARAARRLVVALPVSR
jgi:hypothetical protein